MQCHQNRIQGEGKLLWYRFPFHFGIPAIQVSMAKYHLFLPTWSLKWTTIYYAMFHCWYFLEQWWYGWFHYSFLNIIKCQTQRLALHIVCLFKEILSYAKVARMLNTLWIEKLVIMKEVCQYFELNILLFHILIF